jgi:PiT family inorganic phosphate transporter
MLLALIVLTLVYAYLNGYRDSSGILSGVLASRAMHPRSALFLAAAAEFAGPFLFGLAVARTIATGLIDPAAVSLESVVAAVLAALLWTLFAWWRGIPSSSSHALVGGLLGAALLASGPSAIIPGGLLRVLLPLFLAPPLGFLVGSMAMHLLLFAFSGATPKVNTLFRRLQILTMASLSLAHSANDSGKAIGLITLGLLLAGRLEGFVPPLWVVAACAAAIALGAARADWRLIRTLGGKIYRVRPINALASQVASTGVVLGSSLTGAPVSTSQVISMALMGSGAAERMNKVRWQVGAEMLLTWGLTIPASMALAAALFWIAGELAENTRLLALTENLFLRLALLIS